MKNTIFFLFVFLVLGMGQASAQGVSINTDGSSPHPSAMLDVVSTTKGFLPPRMTEVEMQAISNPEKGLIVFVTDYETHYCYTSNWEPCGFGLSFPSGDLSSRGPVNSDILAIETIVSGSLVILTPGGWRMATVADLSLVGKPYAFLGVALKNTVTGNYLRVALPGSLVRNNSWNWTRGMPIFPSTSSGIFSGVDPSSGTLRISMGYAMSEDVIYFNPQISGNAP